MEKQILLKPFHLQQTNENSFNSQTGQAMTESQTEAIDLKPNDQKDV